MNLQIIFERNLVRPVCLNRRELWLPSTDVAWRCLLWRARDGSTRRLDIEVLMEPVAQ